MKTYTYPAHEIAKEYRRSGLGLTASLVPLLLFGPSSVIVYILGSLVCLFLAYGVRAYDRSRMQIRLTDTEICSAGIREKAINWEGLESVKLSYFSTRRDGENGWMQLKLKGKGVRLRIESTLNDFEGLVDTCFAVARNEKLPIDSASVRNLRALGLISEDFGFQNLEVPEKSS